MEDLSVKISRILASDYTLVKHTQLTHGLSNSETTILWDDEPSKISYITYKDFKESIKRRGSKFYNYNSILSYADFCMALLCARSYSLNHNSVPSINSRSFSAAWRGILTVKETGSDSLKSWLDKHIAGRSQIGYNIHHGINDDSGYTQITTDGQELDMDIIDADEQMLADAVIGGPMEIVTGDDELVHCVASTPESHLSDIKLYNISMALSNKSSRNK